MINRPLVPRPSALHDSRLETIMIQCPRLVLLGAACLVTLWVPATNRALADLVTYNPANPANASRTDGPYTIGFLFEVGGAPLLISHLGAQDVDNPNPNEVLQDGTRPFGDNDGFVTSGNVSVGLWDSTGTTLLASVLVTDTSLQINSWRYEAIAGGPLTLDANTRYLIGARVGSGIEAFLDEGTGANDIFSPNGITFLENRFATGGVLSAPISNGLGTLGRWGAANATFVPVPEPSSLMLMAGSLLLGLSIARRRRNAPLIN